jgi:hypothetical protein
LSQTDATRRYHKSKHPQTRRRCCAERASAYNSGIRKLAWHLLSIFLVPFLRFLKLDNMSIPADVQEFLDDYPGFDDEADLSNNLLFYQNKLRCRPDRKLIDEIHEE